jgi:hypothetical protein
MAQYIIVPNGDGSGFNIAVSGSNGTRQTMMGFDTEADAEAWIAHDKRLDQGDVSGSAYQQNAGAD